MLADTYSHGSASFLEAGSWIRFRVKSWIWIHIKFKTQEAQNGAGRAMNAHNEDSIWGPGIYVNKPVVIDLHQQQEQDPGLCL